MRLNAYLTFDGTAAEAMTFYQSLLGGELTIMRFADMPDTSMVPEGMGDRVANAQLVLENMTLMASDVMGGATMGDVFRGHSGFDLQIALDDVDKGAQLYAALAEGGETQMPWGPQFWAKGFGTLRDRFGVPWMINVD
ncbi:VOC family protein [Tropicibacter alexandrii]|uniref:VOC family protein n=1 Tax=Tropicibacter alexandrii TaxID=2267683 RepID=UPI00197FAC63|nr:VOC family protein [Tropicibacter alexandrii]